MRRARHVAIMYRAVLIESDPDAAARLDALMRRWGVTWVAPDALVLPDPDDWLSVREACDMIGVDPVRLRQWRKRERIVGRKDNGRWQYRAGDVMALATAHRGRKRGEDT
jgi:hypothetical protein